jgi:cellulose synthase operon protein C
MRSSHDRSEGPGWRSRIGAVTRSATLTDIVIGLAVVLLLGFAPAAWVAAERQARPPDPAVELADAQPTSQGPVVKELPAGIPQGITAETPESLRELAASALGEQGAERLLRLLRDPSDSLVWTAVRGGPLGFLYPYRYPAMSRILDQAPAGGWSEDGAALGAALTLLASRRGADGDLKYDNAGAAAFAVLYRAGVAGDCEARLNLLLLVAAEDVPRDEVVRGEGERAMEACPDDPTPGWVLGQFQSLRAQQADLLAMPAPVPDDPAERAFATFEALVERFPDSPDALAGAADAHFREGARTAESQPFYARHEFRIAVELYRRAADGSETTEIEAGLARALIGLGEYSSAADLLRKADDVATPGFRMELLTEAEEAAHDFESAQDTARRLADLGTDAYPQGPALFATPVDGASFEGDDLSIPAVSVGIDRFAPFEVRLQPNELGGGAVVDDVSYVPIYRDDPGYVGTMASCPEWGWRRDAVLAGNAAEATVGLPKDLAFTTVRPNLRRECGVSFELDRTTRDLIRLETGAQLDLRPGRVNLLYDHRQNMWRWGGDLDRAAEVIEEWLDAAPPSAALPMPRLGEVLYLQGSYDASAAAFGAAARRTRQSEWDNDLGMYQASLGRGAALIRAGRQAEGLLLLSDLAMDAERGVAYHQQVNPDYPGYAEDFGAVAYHARTLLADTERETGALAAALENYDAAGEMLPAIEQPYRQVTGHRPERLYGNQAVAELAADRESEAKTSIDRALRVDPMNPAFLMTAGFIADRRGDRAAAIDYNRQALESDPGAFPAANDLGVQLAREQREDEAVAALRQAVFAKADYALGWFNLGVVYGDMGPRYVLASQGAFARAIQLDPELADRKRELTIDANIYRTGLDLSKPLPPRWSFAELERLAPTGSVGLLAVLLLGVGLARSIGKGGQDFAGRWGEIVTKVLGRVPLVARIQAPVWAFGLTVVLFLVTMVRQGWTEVWGLTVAGLAIGTLAGAAIRSRILVAKVSKSEVSQKSWPPGMVLGVAATAAGAPWAPLPVIGDDRSRTQTHAAAPLTLAVIAGVLLLETALLEVPLTKSMSVAALIMAASTLLPVPPLDGGRLEKAGLIAGAGLVGAAVLIVLGIG